MICAIQNNAECAVQLLLNGGIDLELKDLNLQNALDLSHYYNSFRCLFAILDNMDNAHDINLEVLRSKKK